LVIRRKPTGMKNRIKINWVREKIGHCVFTLTLIGFQSTALAQDEWQNLERDWLHQVMPLADSFSEKQGMPPVLAAFQSTSDNSNSNLIGYVFVTPDLLPEEIGFSGPIDVLVGMDLEGHITGTKVLYYLESYKNFRGDFINDSNFLNQFTGKPIEDEFRVGQDIDGMSRATITSWAVSRGIRNTARRVAESYMSGIPYVNEASVATTTLQSLREQSWQDYIDSGFVKKLVVPIVNESALRLSIAYMGHYRLGELLIGAADYSNADRTASAMIEDGHMLLIALSGNTARLRQSRLAVIQKDTLFPNQREKVVFAGTAREGKIAGQAQHAIAMFIDSAVDISQSFTVVYDTGDRSGEFTEVVSVDYELPLDVLSLVTGSTDESVDKDVGGTVITALEASKPRYSIVGRAILMILFAAIAAALFIRIAQLRKTREYRGHS